MHALLIVAAVLGAATDADWPITRRGAVPTGISLSGGVGISERPETGVAFTQEVALSLDLPRRWVAQLGLRLARGGEPAFILINGTAWYRFAFSREQGVISHVGVALVPGGAPNRTSGGTAIVFVPASKRRWSSSSPAWSCSTRPPA